MNNLEVLKKCVEVEEETVLIKTKNGGPKLTNMGLKPLLFLATG